MNQKDMLIESTILALEGRLFENSSKIIGYRSIGLSEFYELLDNREIMGKFSNSEEKQNNSNLDNIICFFKDKIMWKNVNHEILIKCQFNEKDIIDFGTGQYWASKDFAKTKVWTGRRGTVSYNLDEFYVKKYTLNNVIGFYGAPNQSIADFLQKRFNSDWASECTEKLKSLNFDVDALP